jgi:DNA-binding response OmpR family regulator
MDMGWLRGGRWSSGPADDPGRDGMGRGDFAPLSAPRIKRPSSRLSETFDPWLVHVLPMHLLLVEDDPRLADLVARLLGGERHLVDTAGTGQAALEMAEAPGIDAILLDVGLPDVSGLEVARRIRARGSRVPILMLTARDAVSDRVAGLDAGADDYLVKPFAIEELAARVRALGRRGAGGAVPGTALTAGPVRLEEASRVVYVDERPVDLSRREFSLLECLLRHRGQVLSREQLLRHAWPYDSEVELPIVDTYVYFLRRKLGPVGGDRIETVRGVGYRMVA